MNNRRINLKEYKHALLPFLYGIFYVIAFFLLEARPVETYHYMQRDIDHLIPFCEYFVIPYYIWYLYVAATVVYFIFTDRTDFYKMCIMLGTGMTLFLVVSYVYPNAIELRPTTFDRNNLCVLLVKAMYFADTPTNVFPSIHCFNSLACNAALCNNMTIRKKPALLLLSRVTCIMIVLSTLFIKQHCLFDLATAFLLYFMLYIPIYLVPSIKQKVRERNLSSV